MFGSKEKRIIFFCGLLMVFSLQIHVSLSLLCYRYQLAQNFSLSNEINEVIFDQPVLFNFSRVLQGEYDDQGRNFAIDSQENIIIVGFTSSSDFPVFNAYDPYYNGGGDVFLTKLSKNGSLLWSTFIGGSGNDVGRDIGVDQNDNIIITGYTKSNDYPVLNAFDSSYNGGYHGYDSFISKFSPSGTLLWSTFLGGGPDFRGDFGDDQAFGIAIDSGNNIIVVGKTDASDFPIVNSFSSATNIYDEVFITKFFPNGSLQWSSLIGGSSFESGFDIDIDNNDNIIITGYTKSIDFPVLNGYDNTPNHPGPLSGNDAFVLKFTHNGTLLWNTYLGGDDGDVFTPSSSPTTFGYSVTVDSENNLIVTGITFSINFPIKNAFISTNSSGLYGNSFISKFTSNCELLWSTFLGGDNWDQGNGVDVDTANNIYVIGFTRSYDFHTKYAYDSSPNGGGDIFLQKFTFYGELLWSTLLGGDSQDWGYGVYVDNQGDIFATGYTNSSNFPVTNDETSFGGGEDVFISHLIDPLKDNDNDSLFNGLEFSLKLNATNPDTDYDQMTDGWEYQYGFNGSDPYDASQDADNDELTNLEEYNLGLNPKNPDTDSDLMPDGFEYSVGLNANDSKDAWEDKDEDKMPNQWEYLMGLNLLDPTDADIDSDNDSLTNLEEYILGLNPKNSDTDSDLMPDNWEYMMGLNPADSKDALLDFDNDSIPNLHEYLLGLNASLSKDALEDFDQDGLINLEEYILGLDILNNDTDNDKIPDGWEYQMNLNATDPGDAAEDFDQDGLTNLEEFKLKTDPNNSDSDNDGLTDGEEISLGKNPLDPYDATSEIENAASSLTSSNNMLSSLSQKSNSFEILICIVSFFTLLILKKRKKYYH